MPVIDVRGLNKSFGSTPILSGVCCAVHEYDKIGLVGRNGTGKTTLIRILAGLEDYDSGTISMPSGTKLSYLSQNPDIDATRSLMEYALEAFADLDAVEEQMREVERSMAELPPDSTELKEAIRKYDRLMGHMSAREGYDREYRTKAALFGLGFTEDDLDRRLGTFSGGQVMRASLARLLLSEPDLMLLDEPTNHLDLSSMEWLESYLKSYKGSMVLVSHDRYFLEAVIDHVWELEELGLTAYEGSYEDFLAQKEFNLQNRLDQYERQQEYMEKLADYIRRYKAGNRTTMAQSREKMLGRLKARAVTRPRAEAELKIRFSDVQRTGKYAIMAKGLAKAFGDNRLFNGLDLNVERGERLGIVGPNGSGKTTLIRILAGDLIPDEGEVKPGVNMKKAVFYQDIRGLEDDKTVLDHIYLRKPWTQGQARDYLARFLFRGDDVLKRAGDLSGGERNRLMLGMMLLGDPNLLILDEPTNHLDIASRHALEEALSDFEGTVIAASHDRYFLDRTATRILLVEDGRARLFDGNYTYYKQERAKEAGQSRQSSPAPKKIEAQSDRNKSRQERRQKERLCALLSEAESEIARLEEEKARSEAELMDPDTYKDAESSERAAKNHDMLQSKLDEAYERWHELQQMAEEDPVIGLQ